MLLKQFQLQAREEIWFGDLCKNDFHVAVQLPSPENKKRALKHTQVFLPPS
jgi:hypothetical protein